MTTKLLSIVFGLAVVCLSGIAHAADFSGTYQGNPVSIQIQATTAGNYSGVIAANGQQFPFTATAQGNQLSGQFQSQGMPINFTATLDAQGTTLTMQVNGQNYQMTRQRAAPAPAPIPAPAPGPAPAAANGFVGTFQNAQLSMQIQSAGNNDYTGIIAATGIQADFKAKADGNQMTGQFSSQGSDYTFSATLDAQGQTLSLSVGGQTYQLVRQGAAPQPQPTGALGPAPKPADFVGTFQNAQVTIQIQSDGTGGFKGTIAANGQQYQFVAQFQSTMLVGQFQSQGQPYTFSGTLVGDSLTITVGQQSYQLTRQGAAPAQPAGPGPAPAPAGAIDFSGNYAGGQDSMQIQSAGNGNYAGTISSNGQQYQFTAQASGDRLNGQFTGQNTTYVFVATFEAQGQILDVQINGRIYQLTRQAAGGPIPAPQPGQLPAPAPAPAGNIDFTGTFSDGQISMQAQSTGNGNYTGTFTTNNQKFPFTGQASANRLNGQFQGPDSLYIFIATLDAQGQNVSLQVNGKTYQLARQGAAAPGPAPAPAPMPAPSPLPAPGPAPAPAPAQPGAVNFAGSFKSGPIDVEIQSAGSDNFSGTVAANGGNFQLQGHVQAGQLSGQLTGQGGMFNFTATLDASGQTLTMIVEGDKQELTRQPTAAQPPAPPAPAPSSPNPFINLLPQAPNQAPNNNNRGNVSLPPPTPTPGNGASGAPAGYDVIATIKTGTTLMTVQANARSGRQAASTTLTDLSRMFDARPQTLAAVADPNDQKCVETFNATLHGQPIRGVIISGIGPKGAATSVMFDRPDAPNEEWAGLAAALPVPIQWQAQQLPDGSGTMNLPTDWKISDAVKGAVDVVGPQGQAMSLGIADIIETPQGAAAFAQSQAGAGMRPTPPNLPVAPVADPVTSLKNVSEAMNAYRQSHGDPDTVIHVKDILDSTPSEFPNGQAAFIHFTSTLQAKGMPSSVYESVALVIVAPIDATEWMYYFSVVSCPQATFKRDFPTMLQAWQSWKVSDAVLKARIDHAMQDMRDIAQMMQEEEAYREKVYEKCNAAWDQCIIGYSTVGDPKTGMGYTWVPSQNAQELQNKLNVGGNNYVIVPGG